METLDLLKTTDARIWAREFMAKIFSREWAIKERYEDIEETMVGWFANAMAAAEDAKKRRDRGAIRHRDIPDPLLSVAAHAYDLSQQQRNGEHCNVDALQQAIDAAFAYDERTSRERPVLRPWVTTLPMMQQTVLIAAVRGPDGLRKQHPAKMVLRWLRRCVLYSAMAKTELLTPYEPGGGSFTGPSLDVNFPLRTGAKSAWPEAMDEVVTDYLRSIDELPLHFHLHLMHATEILGYKYPEPTTSTWWRKTYFRLVQDLHLAPETQKDMEYRLGDNEEQWRATTDALVE